MPVETKRDEEKWQKAKEIAREEGKAGNWPYIMGTYKRMDPDYQFKSGPKAKKASLKLTEEQKDELHALLKKYKGKPVPDKPVHDMADKWGVPTDELEAYIYGLAGQWVIFEDAKVNPGGRAESKGVTEQDFPRAKIDQGIKVELEHTGDRSLARKIVLDHLAEFPDYYDALKKMERGLEKEGSDFSVPAGTGRVQMLDGFTPHTPGIGSTSHDLSVSRVVAAYELLAAVKRKRRQKGESKVKRRQQYQQHKHQEKTRGKLWRKRNPVTIKKTRRRYKRNPQVHRMIKAVLDRYLET